MTALYLWTILASIAPLAQSHFTFVRLSVNGEWGGPLQYIRNKTDGFKEKQYYLSNYLERTWLDPTYYLDWPDSVRCGRDNMGWANATDVLTVKAGDTIEIAHQRTDPSYWNESYFYNCPDGRGTCDPRWGLDFNHPGPVIVHLSKAPDGQDIRTYDGSGEWVKIFRLGMKLNADKSIDWLTYNRRDLDLPRLVFKIPEQTPAGNYLMRMDLVFSGHVNQYVKIGDILAQMYPSCAQLNIVSDSNVALPKGVLIPDIFDPEVPGMTTSDDMSNFKALDDNYTYPGGPFWDGENVTIDRPLL